MNDRKLPVATQDFLQEIKCDKCKKPLSVAPIRLIEGNFVCGRCPGDGLRMKPLEAFAELLQHPCYNRKEGCNVLLTFGEVIQHENNCDFEKVQCIVKKEFCDWTGPRNNSKMHVESEHCNRVKDGRKKNPISLEILVNRSIQAPYRFLLSVYDDVHKMLSRTLKVSIDSFNGFIRFNVGTILPKTDRDKYSFKVIFSNGQNMLVCLRPCSFKLEIGHDFLRTVFGSLAVVQTDIAANTTEKLSIYENALVKLDCPICLESMRLSIHTGTCGHSVCNNCSPKLQKCPICQKVTMFNIRNYTLENLRDSVF